MMTTGEWLEIVEWIGDRFPDKSWAPEQALAYYADLKSFPAEDIWQAIHVLYEDGQRWAPNGSQLLAEAIKAKRIAARPDRQALPESTEEHDPNRFTEWVTKTFGEKLSGTAIVERLHSEQKPCNNPACEIHYAKTTGGTNAK